MQFDHFKIRYRPKEGGTLYFMRLNGLMSLKYDTIEPFKNTG